MDRRHTLIAGAVVAGAWVVVLLLRSSVAGLAEMYPDALPAHPYFLPGQALRLWVLTPLAVASMVLVLVAPGALLVMAAGAGRSVADLAIKGFAVSYLVRWFLHAAVLVGGQQWSTGLFLTSELLLCAAAWSVLLRRSGQGAGLFTWLERASERRRAITSLVLPALLTAGLVPLIFWQDMTADGLEALMSGLSLNEHVLPRFFSSTGLMGLGVGMAAMAYPTHWFTSLIGPLEAAARLPAILYAPLLFLAVTALIEVRSPRKLRPLEELAVAVVLVAFVTTLGFNGSYEPYATDLSSPAAAFESLTLLAMAGAMLSLWRGETAWFIGFTLLTYFARPTGVLFLLVMAVGSLVLERAERRAWLRRIGIGVLACVSLFIVYEKIFIGIAGGGRAGYLSDSIVLRLQYLRFLDLRRLLFVLVPTGVLPALALFAFRRQDQLARALGVFCIVYFAFFYIQAFVALHHFAPLMLFPVIVFWRIVLHGPERRWAAPAALTGAMLGVILAIPLGSHVFRAPRMIGRSLVYDVGDFLGSYEQYRAARAGSVVLGELFATEVKAVDPSKELALAPGVLVYYAHRYRPGLGMADYVVQPDTAVPPSGFVRVAGAEGMTAFARDTVTWRKARGAAPSTDFRSPLYALPRETLHRHLGIPARNYDLNLGSLPFIWRFFQ